MRAQDTVRSLDTRQTRLAPVTKFKVLLQQLAKEFTPIAQKKVLQVPVVHHASIWGFEPLHDLVETTTGFRKRLRRVESVRHLEGPPATYGWSKRIRSRKGPSVFLELTQVELPQLVAIARKSRTLLGPGASGGIGVPWMTIGAPVYNNLAFTVRLNGAIPGALAILGISLGSGMLGTQSGAIWLDLSAGQLLFPSPPAQGLFFTDANGSVTVPMPIPLLGPSQLVLRTFYAQWGVADPAGAFSLLSTPLALTEGRKVIVRP